MRTTIRQRGTVRMVLPLLTLGGWATLVCALPGRPGAPLLPLLVLATGFEVIASLHINIERIGRYVQVFFEEDEADANAPAWERVSMTFAQQFPGVGTDPMFCWLFVVATTIGGVLEVEAGRQRGVLIAVGLLHVLFIARVLAVRRRAATQRADDLARFRAIAAQRRAKVPRSAPQPPSLPGNQSASAASS